MGTILSHYRILERIGAGGMGEVYRAHDQRLNRDVALKVLPPGTLSDERARRRFREEALALSRLNHPNIATIHDFDTHEGVDFLVMELVEGTSLADRVRAAPLAENEITAVGVQIASALEEAHERGVVHRDVKPGNVVVNPKGRVKVLDFGLARRLRPVNEDATTEAFTEDHQIAGTLPYMSPEELLGCPADHRSDLYSLGVVLYELATGRRPFRQAVSTALADAIIHQPPEPPGAMSRRITPDLERLILKSLDKDPARRYQSAREVRVDLERLSTPTSSAAARRKSPRRRRWMWGLATVLLAALTLIMLDVGGLRDRLTPRPPRATVESLAVLPLENLSGDPGQEYFVDGMTDELIAQLGHLGALRVISWTSARQYKETSKALPEIARELDVDAVVEGTVRRAEGRVRITARLIDAARDQLLWSRSYEREMSGLLKLQSEVARSIAREIRVTLTPREDTRLAAGTVNPEAYDAYLRGRSQWSTLDVAGFRKAIDEFEEAIREDAEFAPAYAGLARAHLFLERWGALPPGEGFRRAKEAASRALELDPSLAEAHVALGEIKSYERDWAGANWHRQRAFELNPGSADVRIAYAESLGRTHPEEAIAQVEEAHRLSPLDPQVTLRVGIQHYMARQYPSAIEWLREALAQQPDRWNAHFYLAQTFAAQAAWTDALEAARKAVSLSHRNVWTLSQLGLVYGLSGKADPARKILEELRQRRDRQPVPAQALARVCMGLGETDEAFQWLDKAYEERIWMSHLDRQPLWDPLRDDPRFQDLVRRMDFPSPAPEGG